MPPFLPWRRPAPLGKQSREPTPRPRGLITSLEIGAEPPALSLEEHTTSGSPLLRMEVLGRLHAHRLILPVGSREGGPIGPLPGTARSADEALPQTTGLGELVALHGFPS